MLKIFSNSRNDRVALAKEKYFEEGVLPTGLVSDQVFQSWMRCYRANLSRQESVAFQTVSLSRSQLAAQKNRSLLEAWVREQDNLLPVIRSSSCSAVLTDPTGLLIGLTPSNKDAQKIIPVAHRLGVTFAEESVGTTAPGLVARTGQQASVLGSEHYFAGVKDMFCAAAPVRGVDGQLAGILDISSEMVPFSFDPSVLVSAYASSIENRLLLLQSKNTIVVKFQFLPGLIDSPLVGMLGINFDGSIIWINSAANSLLKIPFECQAENLKFDEIFDVRINELLQLLGKGPSIQRLPNGFSVYLSANLSERLLDRSPDQKAVMKSKVVLDEDASKVIHSVKTVESVLTQDKKMSEANSVSLRDADAELIKLYLIEYRGNISKVAKRLQVSRGLIYRRMQDLAIDPDLYKK
jgi:transcriptional regulator of acetoin/glycerol metabolism